MHESSWYGGSEWQWVGEQIKEEKVGRESSMCEKESSPSSFDILLL